ncbi:hypothetical protein V7083_18990, partial [Bacillus sp. JJ1764]
DRSTCILFGAGAVLVEKDEQSKIFIGFNLGSDGRGTQHVYRTGLSKNVNAIDLLDTQYLVYKTAGKFFNGL